MQGSTHLPGSDPDCTRPSDRIFFTMSSCPLRHHRDGRDGPRWSSRRPSRAPTSARGRAGPARPARCGRRRTSRRRRQAGCCDGSAPCSCATLTSCPSRVSSGRSVASTHPVAPFGQRVRVADDDDELVRALRVGLVDDLGRRAHGGRWRVSSARRGIVRTDAEAASEPRSEQRGSPSATSVRVRAREPAHWHDEWAMSARV